MNEKDAVRKAFSKNKDAYIISSTHSTGSDLSLLKEWINPQKTMRVLDIATGGGHVAKHLSPFVKFVHATDLTQSMLENIEFILADAENLPFLNNRFDVVTCRIAAHHFPTPEKFIKEVFRVLKPTGNFMFIDNIASEDKELDHFINTLEKMRDFSHVRSLKISEWKQLLEQVNLEIIKENRRKKVLPFDEWSKRTLDTEEQIREVADFLVHSSKDIHTYHQIKIKNGMIDSFAIDEWMVLCEK
ncbi:class I SAM-dependent methyltransferase [Pseudogracilibacillus sp. SO30301A]|uniref:class I SAM-dependent methyltransferase n=1 Tax=Pseudogracilibacillus sp. SO30301A TaxID=3098291 RepID=UPI00300E5DB0